MMTDSLSEIPALDTCRAGHPYDDANTYHHPNGSRVCRRCAVETQRRYVEPRGTRKTGPRFSDDDIRAIRSAYANGTSMWTLAQEHKVAWTTIKRIVRRTTYKGVE